MNARLGILFCCFLMIYSAVRAQKYEFGEVTKAELEMTSFNKFPEADAVILHKEVVVGIGRYVEVSERIKIFNEDGYDYSTIVLPYRNVKKIKGATFNLVNGEIEETKLDKDLIFSDEVVKDVTYKKFTFPKVQPGSVLEYTYISDNGITRDVNLQHEIPVKKIRVEAKNFTSAKFKMTQNPRAYLSVQRLNSDSGTVVVAVDVAPLEEEPYVYDMDMYRGKLQFKFGGYENSLKLDTWDDISRELYEYDDFGMQMKPRGYYKELLENVIEDEIDKMKQVELIYNFLKENIEWDETYGFIPEQGSRDTYNYKKGDVADINLLFISMLKSLGIESYPVLASTKSHGVPLTASLDGINYVVASVYLNNQYYLFDAAHDKATFNYLPEILLNWKGLLLKKDSPVKALTLTTPKYSEKKVIGMVTMDEDLFIEGKIREQSTGYYAINSKAYLKNLGDKDVDDLIQLDMEGLEISNVEVQNKEDQQETLGLTYAVEIDNGVDEISDKLYFSPMLFFGVNENPFTKEERLYPVDFGFPKKLTRNLTVNIPEGYAVEAIPEPLKILMPDGLGNYEYRIMANGNRLQVQSKWEINTPVISQGLYGELKEFYKVRIEKENEKVVLSKL